MYLNPLLSRVNSSEPSVPSKFLEPPRSPPIFSATSSTFRTSADVGAVMGSAAFSSASLILILTVLVIEFDPSDLVSSNSYMLSPSASDGLSKLGLSLKKKALPLSLSTTTNLSASAPPVIVEVTGPGNLMANSSSVVKD